MQSQRPPRRITSGQFERYFRRAGGRNASRRRTLIAALRQHFGDRVEIAGENTGVHLLVWLNDIRPRDLDAIIARAARVGVGVYPIGPYYARPPRRAGLLFGYASRKGRSGRGSVFSRMSSADRAPGRRGPRDEWGAKRASTWLMLQGASCRR